MLLRKLSVAVGIAIVAAQVQADATNFDKFDPLMGNPGALPVYDPLEAAPFVLSSPDFRQVTIVKRDTAQVLRGDSGNYDMQTVNENGPDAGRYLFAPYETSQAGIQRTDLRNMQTETIFFAPAPGDYVAFDASRWTPWGSYLTAEESWSDPGSPPSPYGRLFEVTNPLADAGDIEIVHRDILPRVSHEGLAFDKDNNLYFIDERNNSHIFKYTSRKPNAATGDEFFARGQSFVLRVGDGTVEEATGKAAWIPLTNADGDPLPGAVIVYGDEVDGRATPDLPAFRGTDFDRPEDVEIKTLRNGKQQLYVATTTNNKVFSIDLERTEVKLFASRDTTDMATGSPAGSEFTSPDNLAIDADGNVYIIEDQPGGREDTWFAVDRDEDGVAEAMGKWASLRTDGAEATGLYFDPFNPHIAYINVQHPSSGEDRTIMLLAPAVKADKGKHLGTK
jgi:sugar lactone lactonase YvrE